MFLLQLIAVCMASRCPRVLFWLREVRLCLVCAPGGELRDERFIPSLPKRDITPVYGAPSVYERWHADEPYIREPPASRITEIIQDSPHQDQDRTAAVINTPYVTSGAFPCTHNDKVAPILFCFALKSRNELEEFMKKSSRKSLRGNIT